MYDDAAKEKLNELLLEFKKALETNNFPQMQGEKKKNCKYCIMKSLCDEDFGKKKSYE